MGDHPHWMDYISCLPKQTNGVREPHELAGDERPSAHRCLVDSMPLKSWEVEPPKQPEETIEYPNDLSHFQGCYLGAQFRHPECLVEQDEKDVMMGGRTCIERHVGVLHQQTEQDRLKFGHCMFKVKHWRGQEEDKEVKEDKGNLAVAADITDTITTIGLSEWSPPFLVGGKYPLHFQVTKGKKSWLRSDVDTNLHISGVDEDVVIRFHVTAFLPNGKKINNYECHSTIHSEATDPDYTLIHEYQTVPSQYEDIIIVISIISICPNAALLQRHQTIKTASMWSPMCTKYNYVPIDEKTASQLKKLCQFINHNPQLIRGGKVIAFVDHIKGCRDDPNDVPMDLAMSTTSYFQYDSEYMSMGGYSMKSNDNPYCWCWSNGSPQCGGGSWSNFCRLHHVAKV